MSGIDPVTEAVLAYVGAGALKVAMAPFDAVHDEWRDRIRTRLARVRKSGEFKADGRPLDVPDRVVFKTLTEGAFTDDELTADYLGGVLAASGPDDDSGAAVVAQIGRLSAHQLRFHYLVYREVRRLWVGPVPNLYMEAETRRAGIRIPMADLDAGMDGGSAIIPSILPVLHREGLIGDGYQWGPEESGGIRHGYTCRVVPTAMGAELFLWGHGSRPMVAYRLFDAAAEVRFLTEVPATPGVSLLAGEG